MKAKFVFENINFERGKEPKDAMKIGIKNIDWGFRTGYRFQRGRIVKITNYNNIPIIVIKGSQYYLACSPLNYRLKNRGEKIRGHWRSTVEETIKDLIRKIDQYHISESIDFERGIEPKDAMKIGIDNIDWGYGPNYLKMAQKDNRLEIVGMEKYKTALILITKSKNYIPLEDTPYMAMSNIRNEVPDPRLNIGSDWHKTKEEALEDAKERLDKKYFLKESIDFERGIEPRDAMKIGRRAQIEEWLDYHNIPENLYKISNDLTIIIDGKLDFYHQKRVTSLPDNLIVKGSLDLDGTSITSLPDNLIVKDWLDIRGTNITSLPDDLSVGSDLVIRGTKIDKLPDNLKVFGLIFVENETQLKNVPSHLEVRITLPPEGL